MKLSARIAVAMAVSALRQEHIKKIVLVRPAVEAGEKIGFLPGDMLAKVNPFLRPLLDALTEMLDAEQVQRYLEKEVIEEAHLDPASILAGVERFAKDHDQRIARQRGALGA